MIRAEAYRRSTFLRCAPLVLLTVGSTPILQTASGQNTTEHGGHSSSAATLTEQQKIALALKAAPPEIGENATIEDITQPSAKPRRLRTGSNGWVCYASAEMPMCLDAPWQAWLDAWANKKELKAADRVGIAYMLKGDNGASNTDPYATGPTAENQWVVSPAHLMILFPDPKMLDSYPTDPKTGGPWVMWKGTSLAHLMVPVSPTARPVMASK